MRALSTVITVGRSLSTASATGLSGGLAQHLLKKRPLLMGGGGGAGRDSRLPRTSHGFHSSAPSLGGGTPGEWNHAGDEAKPDHMKEVWNWKIKKRLATMEEEGDKLKTQQQGGSSSSSSSSSSSGNGGEGFGPLPGEKVIALDENLPDGALEAYWAQLRREREAQEGGGGKEKEEDGKAKRSTIKRHLLFGWNYAPKKNKGGGGAGAAGGKRGARLSNKAPAPEPAAAAATASAAGK